MYRVGGFPEYSPKEQKLFDAIMTIINKTYHSYGYQHILTPSVERIDVLKKGGDEVANQIFGLYGLAQGAEDAKEYALHFDLTVPFARYVLDWQNDLTFPFKRYQMQPVWRGERTQKGRYKEFRQADIDVIWPDKDQGDKDYNAFYDADIISTLAHTLSNIFTLLGRKEVIEIHVNDKKLLQHFLDEEIKSDAETSAKLLSLFDKFYKLDEKEFYDKVEALIGSEGVTKIRTLVAISDAELALRYPALSQVIKNITIGSPEQIKIVFDPFIVRGLDYYTGTVFETFIKGRTDLGSFCSGGAYHGFTTFIDPKRVYSGVGGSIGLSRLFSILTEELQAVNAIEEKSFLVVHFENMKADADHIADAVRRSGFPAEVYPFPDKLGKQIQYADKKGLTRVVIFGEAEKLDGIFKVKHLSTGDERIYKIDQPIE